MNYSTRQDLEDMQLSMDSLLALKQTTWYRDSSAGSSKLFVGEQDHIAFLLVDTQKVCKILKNSGARPFEIITKSNGEKKIKKTNLSQRLLRLITQPLEDFRLAFPHHRFNPLFRAFILLRPKLSHITDWNHLISLPENHQLEIAQAVNNFSEAIKKLMNRPRFMQRLWDYRASGLKNYRNLMNYIKHCFMKRSNLLFIRIDLSYRAEVAQHFHKDNENSTNNLDFNKMRSHRDAFLKHLKRKFKKALIGHIWRLEYGYKKKAHFHTLIILDESQHQSDILIGKQLGEHWVKEITDGMGQYYNCNAKKDQYHYCMLGKVRVDNTVAWQGIHYFNAYVSLPDLYVKLAPPDGHRALGKGVLNIKSLSLAGRPSKYKISEWTAPQTNRRDFLM